MDIPLALEGSVLGAMIQQPSVANQTGHRGLLDASFGLDFVAFGMDLDPRAVLTAAQQ